MLGLWDYSKASPGQKYGDDDITYRMMTHPGIKCSGVVSVVSNVVPAAVEQMTREALAGSPRARELADALAPLFGIVTVKVKDERKLPGGKKVMVEDKFRNPLPVKTLMAGLGMPAGPCRQPLGRLSPAGVAVVRDAARAVWQKDPGLLKPIEEFYKVDIKERLKNDAYWS